MGFFGIPGVSGTLLYNVLHYAGLGLTLLRARLRRASPQSLQSVDGQALRSKLSAFHFVGIAFGSVRNPDRSGEGSSFEVNLMAWCQDLQPWPATK